MGPLFSWFTASFCRVDGVGLSLVQGYIRFEGEFTAEGCKTVSTDPMTITPGNGGALWNGPDGKVVFKGSVAMSDNGERVS